MNLDQDIKKWVQEFPKDTCFFLIWDLVGIPGVLKYKGTELVSVKIDGLEVIDNAKYVQGVLPTLCARYNLKKYGKGTTKIKGTFLIEGRFFTKIHGSKPNNSRITKFCKKALTTPKPNKYHLKKMTFVADRYENKKSKIESYYNETVYLSCLGFTKNHHPERYSKGHYRLIKRMKTDNVDFSKDLPIFRKRMTLGYIAHHANLDYIRSKIGESKGYITPKYKGVYIRVDEYKGLDPAIKLQYYIDSANLE